MDSELATLDPAGNLVPKRHRETRLPSQKADYLPF